ncbi:MULTISPECIES: monovalent cation:proton antiporter-2 (CPA2) family protein [Pseudomonas]|uniref:monovalent cation:proton antiporter-2 (CPA2) family protein n=1 Tax=Pseudomonas TaxID=286 RepID=UPI001F223ADF|nr:monovalent cation:proton antiporter-2 (CPA2) family protein [Pseudomonas sputi]
MESIANHEISMLQAAVIFLSASVLIVPISKHLQLGAVLGYLLAGVLIGPSAFGLIGDPQSVSRISELGVVLLLFLLGLEMSPQRLWVMRKTVLGVGLTQVLLTALVIGAVALISFGQSLDRSLILGFGLALSSTAFGLQILAERNELSSPHGHLAFAILLFQDIAAIPLIATIPLLNGVTETTAAGDVPQHICKVLLSLSLVVFSGRYLLRPVFRIVAKSGLQEVSTATALLVVFGTAWLMDLAGISMALGAFLAGLLLADSEYRHELKSQVEPFKGLLLGLFFISVGMTADLRLLLVQPGLIFLLTSLLIALKLPLLYFISRLAGGLDRHAALQISLILAAGGEFAFVVFKTARDQNIFGSHLYNILVLAITLSMALTPFLVLGLTYFFKKKKIPISVPMEYHHTSNDTDTPKVIIAGVGRMGQIIARVMRAQGVPFLALDTAVEPIEYSRSVSKHMPIFYGDASKPEILRAANAGKAELIIIATDDPDANLRTAKLVRQLYPKIKIIGRARNRQHAHQLLDLKATPVRELFHSSLEMSRIALLKLGLSETQALSRIRHFQQHDEKLLADQYLVYDDEAAVIQTAREARVDLETLFESDILKERRSENCECLTETQLLKASAYPASYSV